MTEPAKPFPSLLASIWLTGGSWLLIALTLDVFAQSLGPIAALGLGIVTGLGVAGTLAAQRVPPPQAERIGLRGFAPRLLPVLLLLLPAALLVSEVDNVIRSSVSTGDAEPAAAAEAPAGDLDTDLFVMETAIVLVGLAPVVEEFFFRGVIQQGLVASNGTGAGLFATALLYAIGHGNLVGTPAAWLSTTLGSLLTGVLLGYVRLASGSLLASILLSMATAAGGMLAVQLEDTLPIPGFNAPGDHTPFAWLLPALISVALGLVLLRRERARAGNDSP